MEFQVSTPLNVDVEKESQKKIKKLCKISLIVGIIGLIAYILIGVIAFEEGEEPFWLEILLIASSVLFAIGLVMPIALNAATKKSLSTIHNVINQYEFYDEYVIVKSYRGEEKIAEAKNYYRELTKTRLTENFVYLHLGLRGAYPVARAALTEEQQAWLLALKKK